MLADPQWLDALSSFFAKRWPEAVQRFEALEARYPGEHRVESRLTEARRQRDIDACSSKAEFAAAAEDWATLVTALEDLTRLDPNFPDVAARLEQARIAQRRKALVDEMTPWIRPGDGMPSWPPRGSWIESTRTTPTRVGSSPTRRPRFAKPHPPIGMRRHSTT